MITEQVINFQEDVQKLLSVLPINIKNHLTNHSKIEKLYEVVMDIGHPHQFALMMIING